MQFIQISEEKLQVTNFLCWRKYLQDFVKLEFHITHAKNEVLNTLAEHFHHMFVSEKDVFVRFLKLHTHVSVKHLNIIRCLPTLFHLQDYGLEHVIADTTVMQPFRVSDQIPSLLIDSLYNLVTELLSSSNDDSIQKFKAWHELFLQSVSLKCILYL